MHTQTDTATSNSAVLNAVDAKMIALAAALTKLDNLTAKRVALAESLATLKREEAGHLRDHDVDENTAVQNLIQVRGRADVQTARANSLDHEIQEQKAAAVRIGNDAGSAAQNLFSQLLANRTATVTRIFDENFKMPYSAAFPKSHLIEESKLVRETRDLLSPRFSSIHVPTDDRLV